MLRGYRGIVAALVGLILVAASPSGQRSDPQQTKTQQEVSESLGRIADALDEVNKPQRETADCPEGGEDRQSDLCAQWKAADAAKQAADATDWTVTIGWIGAALGTITMGAAIAAAFFAWSAADHTRIGNTIALQTDKLQNEPKIQLAAPTINIFSGGEEGEFLYFRLTGTNQGNSPSLAFSLTADAGIVNADGVALWSKNNILTEANVQSVASRGEFTATRRLDPFGADFHALKTAVEQGGCRVNALITITYDTEYKERITLSCTAIGEAYVWPPQPPRTALGAKDWAVSIDLKREIAT